MAWLYREIAWHPGCLEKPRPNGCVLEHREVGSQMIGRRLKEGEVVHHEDRDKTNNDPNNLIVFDSIAAHNRYHAGAALVPLGDGTFTSEVRSRRARRPVQSSRPDEGTLRDMANRYTSREIAELIGVSDTSVGKWLDHYGIPRPGRGYRKRLAGVPQRK